MFLLESYEGALEDPKEQSHAKCHAVKRRTRVKGDRVSLTG